MINLKKIAEERDAALQDAENEVIRLLGDKYQKIKIQHSHDFDTGVSSLIFEIPVYTEPEVQETVSLPVLEMTDWAALLEGTLFHDRETDRAVRAVFYRLNPEIQRYLIRFTPDTSHAWLKRAQFWREILEPALPTKMYYEAMIRLCNWYRHCINLREGKIE